MRGSSSSIVSPETEYGGRDFVRKPDAFRRKSVDTSGDLGLLAVPPSTAMNKTKCRSAVTYWSRVIEFFTQPSVFSYLLFGLLFHIVFEQFSAQFSILNIHKRRQDEALVPRYSNSFIPLSLPKEPNITLLTTGFEGYSPARQKELYLVAFRNINLGFQQYHRLCDPRCAHIHSTDTKTSFKNMKGQVTYRHLFEEANKFIGSIVVIANADIYFDHSIYCAGLLHERAVLALSRHPSPDCISSARGPSGREPLDFCGGYDPKFAASHDGFVFIPPVPQLVLDGLEGLPVNEFGAENVVIHMMQTAGYDVLNPCERIHLFHQHCGNERASSAKKRVTSPKWRRLFGSTKEWGYGSSSWIRKDLRSKFGTVDCMALGMLSTRNIGLH